MSQSLMGLELHEGEQKWQKFNSEENYPFKGGTVTALALESSWAK